MLQHITANSRRVWVSFGLLAVTTLLGLTPERVGAESAQENPLVGSPSLEQKVHIHAEGVAISDLLALVAKQTGVDLTVRSEAADDKVIVVGPPRPLKDVLADLAALFNDTWLHTATPDGKDHYTLYRSRSAMEYEETLARHIKDRMMEQLDATIAAARSPSPYDYEVYRVAAQVLGLLSFEQKQQLLLHRSLNLPFALLTPAEQVTARQAANTIYNSDAAAAAQRNLPYERPPDSELEQGGLRFLIQNAGSDSSESRQHLFLIIGPAYSEDFGTLDDRIPWLLPIRGNPYTHKAVPSYVAISDGVRMDQAINEPSISWPARLEALSEQTGTPILADYYRCQPPPLPTVDPFLAEKGDSGRLALDQMGRKHSVLWWIRGNTLLLRKRNWYTQRLSEVPDRWVLHLQKHLAAQKGIPSYGDVLTLTELTRDQLAGLRTEDGSHGILGERVDANSLAGLPELLALYKTRYPSNSRTPVPNRPTKEEDLRRATLTYDDLTEEDRSLVLEFLRSQPNPVSLAEIGESFFVLLTRGSLQAGQMRSAHVDLLWTKGSYALTLPASLVEDRRDKTEVQITP